MVIYWKNNAGGLNLKKYLAGFVCGALFFSGVSYAASGDLTAKITNFKILINGEQQELNNNPVLIDGTTYLPLRDISKTLGYNVEFSKGVISLNHKNESETDKKNETHSRPEILSRIVYPLKLTFNGEFIKEKQYFGYHPGDFYRDSQGKIYVSPGFASSIVLAGFNEINTISFGESNLHVIDDEKRAQYYVVETKYMNSSEKYEDAVYYNKDRSKKYEISGNRANPKGVLLNSGIVPVVPFDDLVRALELPVRLHIDDAKHEVVIDVTIK
ncbi:hypothetical protein EBB07_20560 [Paenibacillaceae bacterium]|nr:hypothetical protein EBB07_20560 [Paenibacillaceae bacterium]